MRGCTLHKRVSLELGGLVGWPGPTMVDMVHHMASSTVDVVHHAASGTVDVVSHRASSTVGMLHHVLPGAVDMVHDVMRREAAAAQIARILRGLTQLSCQTGPGVAGDSQWRKQAGAQGDSGQSRHAAPLGKAGRVLLCGHVEACHSKICLATDPKT